MLIVIALSRRKQGIGECERWAKLYCSAYEKQIEKALAMPREIMLLYIIRNGVVLLVWQGLSACIRFIIYAR